MADFHEYVVSRSKSGGKFWEVKVEGAQMSVRYGKLGQEKSWTVKDFASPEKALAEAQKKLKQKMNKGYLKEMEAWDFEQRIDQLEAALTEAEWVHLLEFQRGEPITQAQIDQVQEAIGFELEPRFLAFYRVCNGLSVRWVSRAPEEDNAADAYFNQRQGTAGSIQIEPLGMMTSYGDLGQDMSTPDDYHVRLLGGWDEYVFRGHLKEIDHYLDNNIETAYYKPGMVVHPKFPDPPVIMTDDYLAAISDRHPMLARHYVQMVIATLGVSWARVGCFKNRGFGGNHAIYVPADNWMDGFPDAKTVLDYLYTGSPAGIRTQLEQLADLGQSSHEYTHYNDPNE